MRGLSLRPCNILSLVMTTSWTDVSIVHSLRVRTMDSGPQRARPAWVSAGAQGSLRPQQMLTGWATLTEAGSIGAGCLGLPKVQTLASVRTSRSVDAACLRRAEAKSDNRWERLSIYSLL